jgi:hypothetical protein
MEACPGAESFVNANGSDRSKSSGAAKCLGSWRSTGGFWLGELWAQRHRTRDAVRTGENALPKDDPANVMRFKAAAVKRVQAHRWRRRMGLRCLTVRVSDRELRHLISTGCLSLERSEDAPAVALAALELTLPATLLSRDMHSNHVSYLPPHRRDFCCTAPAQARLFRVQRQPCFRPTAAGAVGACIMQCDRRRW